MISFKSIKAGFNLNEPAFFKSWLKIVLKNEGSYLPGEIQYVFCDDAYLKKINKKYLNHHTSTDIITFPNSSNKSIISGDIFISIERIDENKKIFNNSLHQEISRVIVHGLLHLIGYDDETDDEKTLMTQKEDYYLSLQAKKFPNCFT